MERHLERRPPSRPIAEAFVVTEELERVRRRSGRPPRAAGLDTAIVPRRLVNPWPPLETLSQDGLLAIMDWAYSIL